ncbi:MAG TPA: ABC-type transport auxiliary lipoprotein family protein [Luteimonas sp.]|nr:ABC-type transport auxiliary lipoprotein family protein [Luteimonas sp.]
MVAMLAMGGCALLGGSHEPATIYAPQVAPAPDPAWPALDWQLSISRPEASRIVGTTRIAVRPEPGEVQVYKGALWAKAPDEQLQDALLRELEASGKLRAVARQGSGMSADHRLELDLRRFDADYAGNAVPSATVEVGAMLLGDDNRGVIASRNFIQAVPAAGTDPAQVSQAFGQALQAIAHDIAGWTLQSGAAQGKAAR